jgi:cytochrome c-type biogenesis protein CcmH/NrfF
MIIHTKGKIPILGTLWWIGLIVRCENCGTVAEMEHEDCCRMRGHKQEGNSGLITTKIECPVCEKVVDVESRVPKNPMHEAYQVSNHNQ